MKATRFAPRNVRERNSGKSTIGSRTRGSIRAKAATPATAVASSATISAEPQPQELPSTRASTSAVRPTVRAPMPPQSIVGWVLSSRDSRVANSVTITAPTATGRFRKKIARQDTYSASAPPTTGPIARARADTPAQVPIALPRSSAGKVTVMMDSVAGIMKAAPIPWTARPPTSQPWSGDSAIAALETANTTTPKRNMRRRPNMSPRRPPVTRRTAKVSV
jgi:hypothetical protein